MVDEKQEGQSWISLDQVKVTPREQPGLELAHQQSQSRYKRRVLLRKRAAITAALLPASGAGKWQFQSQTGISSGAQTVTLNGCYVKVGTAYEEFYPIATNTPLLISDGTNTETVTPTARSRYRPLSLARRR
jgi:hypothetical protein